MTSNLSTSTWFIIDDDVDDQEIFSIAVENLNQSIQCIFARDGAHALEKLSTDPSFFPDCIFLDVNMPRMNGVECLIELRKMQKLASVPVYMCSTSADPKIVAETKNLGAKDFIVKPSTISEFAKTLSILLHDLKR